MPPSGEYNDDNPAVSTTMTEYQLNCSSCCEYKQNDNATTMFELETRETVWLT